MPLGLLMCLLCSLVFQPFRHLLKSKYSSVRCLTCISEITCIVTIFLYLFKIFKIFYLFIFREGKGGRKRGGETSMCGCLSSAPCWGLGPKPRHVSCLGIEPATLWFSGWHLIHWATLARADYIFLEKHVFPHNQNSILLLPITLEKLWQIWWVFCFCFFLNLASYVETFISSRLASRVCVRSLQYKECFLKKQWLNRIIVLHNP